MRLTSKLQKLQALGVELFSRNGKSFVRKKDAPTLQALASLKGKWEANHPPIPVPIKNYYGELEGEFALVDSPSGRDGSWAYQIITEGPDSPPAVEGFRTKEEAMQAAEDDILGS